jgi:hypothetical protein
LPFALIAPEPRRAHCCAQLPGFCLLRTRRSESTLEIGFSSRRISPRPGPMSWSNDEATSLEFLSGIGSPNIVFWYKAAVLAAEFAEGINDLGNL